VAAGQPPLRLPLGTDTLQAIADKHAFVEAEVKEWRALSASTDFPKEALAGLSALFMAKAKRASLRGPFLCANPDT
jgi:hypothetical protein